MERFSPTFVVAASTVYRGASVFDKPLVRVDWTGVSSFSKKMFAMIRKFDVTRLKEELVTNVPWIRAFEVWISMYVAFTG